MYTSYIFYGLTPGSLADWIMVLISLLGTLVIAGSFINQLGINKQQAKINRLLTEKERREIRPWFKVKDFQIGFGGYVTIELSNWLAVNVRIDPAKGGKYIVMSNLKIEFLLEVNSTFTITFKPNSEENNITRESKLLTIYSQAEDELSCYQQEVWVKNDKPYITIPKRISEYKLVLIPGHKPRKSID